MIAFSGGLGAFFMRSLVAMMWNGFFTGRWGVISRREQPVGYWIGVGFALLFVLMSLVLLIVGALNFWHSL